LEIILQAREALVEAFREKGTDPNLLIWFLL